eukprot:scaffold10.g2470.t1
MAAPESPKSTLKHVKSEESSLQEGAPEAAQWHQQWREQVRQLSRLESRGYTQEDAELVASLAHAADELEQAGWAGGGVCCRRLMAESRGAQRGGQANLKLAWWNPHHRRLSLRIALLLPAALTLASLQRLEELGSPPKQE